MAKSIPHQWFLDDEPSREMQYRVAWPIRHGRGVGVFTVCGGIRGSGGYERCSVPRI